LSFCTFSFGHCAIYPPSIYDFVVIDNLDNIDVIQGNLSKPNPFGTEEFVQFRQVFGLHRFKLHRYLVNGTVKSVWFRQIFGLLRVQ